MRRIQEQIGRGKREHNLRLGNVDRDVTLARLLVQEHLNQLRRILEGVAKDQPTPATVYGNAGLSQAGLVGAMRPRLGRVLRHTDCIRHGREICTCHR